MPAVRETTFKQKAMHLRYNELLRVYVYICNIYVICITHIVYIIFVVCLSSCFVVCSCPVLLSAHFSNQLSDNKTGQTTKQDRTDNKTGQTN